LSLVTTDRALSQPTQFDAREIRMQELDLVVLTHALATHGLEQGDVGTIVHVYQHGQAYKIEFATAEGAMVAVLTLTGADV